MWCLVRIFTICLHNVLLNSYLENIQPITPKLGNVLNLLIRVDNSIFKNVLRGYFIPAFFFTKNVY